MRPVSIGTKGNRIGLLLGLLRRVIERQGMLSVEAIFAITNPDQYCAKNEDDLAVYIRLQGLHQFAASVRDNEKPVLLSRRLPKRCRRNSQYHSRFTLQRLTCMQATLSSVNSKDTVVATAPMDWTVKR